MRVYLVRHGLAEDHNPAGDVERALTPRGKLRMAEEATGLRKLRVRPELILTSPLRRALESATILAQELGGIRVELLSELGQSPYSPAGILAALGPYANLKDIALVGHLPGLAELASFMLTGAADGCRIEVKKGAVLCLEQGPQENQGRFALNWLLTPRALRSM